MRSTRRCGAITQTGLIFENFLRRTEKIRRGLLPAAVFVTAVALAGCGPASTPKAATSTGRMDTATASPSATWTEIPTVSATRRPTRIQPAERRVTGIAAGEGHSCALMSEGKVMCWGKNEFGQLGDGTLENHSSPVAVSGLVGARALAAGWAHTCALLNSGMVRCWGYNKNGELGNGGFENSNHPILVAGLTGKAVALAAGDDHTCAALEDGSVMCWGFNETGQLGNGETGDHWFPVAVEGLAGKAIALTAGWGHTCALLEGGMVQCWGANGSGQLGSGSGAALSRTPVTVSGMAAGISAVSAKGGHTCALRTAGGVDCWGSNQYGELGDGTAETSPTPVPAKLPGGVQSIAAGWNHTCAILDDGKMMCWGWNYFGQLGDKSMTSQLTPVSVTGLPGEAALMGLGWRHSCASIDPGLVKCWGADEYGQGWSGWLTAFSNPAEPPAASPTVTRTPTPTPKAATPLPLNFEYQPLDAGGNHTCAVTKDGKVKCWGSNQGDLLGVDPVDAPWDNPISNPQDVIGLSGKAVAVAAGGDHTCALIRTGKVMCWGANYSGEIGDSTQIDRRHPALVLDLPDGATAVAAGGGHSCAVVPQGVMCWGANNNNQIGRGSAFFQLVPFAVGGLPPGMHNLSTISDHTCGLTAEGRAVCWGLNENGQLGDGTDLPREEPVTVAGLPSRLVSIAAGRGHSCAVAADGAVYCWGDNIFGQLGDGTNQSSYLPVKVSQGADKAVRVVAGFYYSCYLTDAGQAKCWGLNNQGQLGNGTTANSRIPEAVVTTLPLTFLEAGDTHTCAMVKEGFFLCWGSDLAGQLGDAQTTSSAFPVSVIWPVP